MPARTHWASRIAALRPVLALVLLISALISAEILGFAVAWLVESRANLLPSRAQMSVSTAIGLLIYLGYPTAISVYLFRTLGSVVNVKFGLLTTALAVTFAGHMILAIIGHWMPQGGSRIMLLANFVTPLTLIATLYILWTAARALVYAEEAHKTSFNRVIGTFFMFLLLPLGIFFLARRVKIIESHSVGEISVK